jgi:hypothetical protein
MSVRDNIINVALGWPNPVSYKLVKKLSTFAVNRA